MVNGIVYDFESIKVMLPTGQIGTCENVKYGVKKDIDVKTDKYGLPRGEVRKDFEGDFEMDMSLFDFEKLNKSASATGILGMFPFPVVIAYGDGAAPRITDSITVKITETPREMKKGEEVMMKITGKQTSIPLLNGVPAYIPRV